MARLDGAVRVETAADDADDVDVAVAELVCVEVARHDNAARLVGLESLDELREFQRLLEPLLAHAVRAVGVVLAFARMCPAFAARGEDSS